MKKDAVTVYFGGQARELWTNEGLTVLCSGGVPVDAARSDDGGWLARAPSPERCGDVKADMALHSRALELCCRINEGSAPPLTLACFRACCEAAQPDPAPTVITGGCEAVTLPERLRTLLDDEGRSWDEAVSAVAGSFVFRPRGGGVRVPLSALAALRPRTARLVEAVNEKLCAELWRAFPGDWRRIGDSAVVRDGEIDLFLLAAVMCGEIHCDKETRAGKLRTLYTLRPAKFKTDDHN